MHDGCGSISTQYAVVPAYEQPTVHDEYLTADVTGAFGGEEGDDVGDVLGLAYPAHRDELRGLLESLRTQRVLLGERLGSTYVARGDAVYAYTVACELHGQAPHETDDAGLGRRVLDVFVPPIGDAHDRRHGYDGPASRRPHRRSRGAANPHDPFQVYLVRMVPLLIGQLRKGYAVGDPGVGHDSAQR